MVIPMKPLGPGPGTSDVGFGTRGFGHEARELGPEMSDLELASRTYSLKAAPWDPGLGIWILRARTSDPGIGLGRKDLGPIGPETHDLRAGTRDLGPATYL